MVHFCHQLLALLNLAMLLPQFEVSVCHRVLDPLIKALNCRFVARVFLHATVTDHSISVHDLSLVYLAENWVICQPRDLERVEAAS